MNPEPTSTLSAESKPIEKPNWTPPVLKKMDIEETAVSVGPVDDGDGTS